MKTQQVAPSRGKTNLVLATLFLGVFVLGSAELLMVGVLDLIAADLHVSIPAAGALVTANALGLAIGGPILTALTMKLNKRTTLIGTLIAFIVATIVPLLISNYELFIVMRTLAGAFQGLFIAVGFVVGIAVVGQERMGRAIAAVVSGVAVSAALGVPLGTLLGQTIGWQDSFTAIVVIAVIEVIVALALIPSMPNTGGSAVGQAKYAFAPRVLAVLGLNFLVFAALYAALTYIVPFLQNVTGISGTLISVFLLAYGVATAIGTFGGGRFADKNPARTLIVATIASTAAMLALYLAGPIAFLVALAMLVWGVFAFGMVPSLQARVVTLAGPGGQLASSLPASAANLGIAFGSIVGGVAVGSFTVSAAVITGMIIAAIAIPVAWTTSYLKPPVVEGTATRPAAVEPTRATEPVLEPV
jgi:MFS transporter, DHA1 family, inner membrane transport protein